MRMHKTLEMNSKRGKEAERQISQRYKDRPVGSKRGVSRDIFIQDTIQAMVISEMCDFAHWEIENRPSKLHFVDYSLYNALKPVQQQLRNNPLGIVDLEWDFKMYELSNGSIEIRIGNFSLV